MPAAAHPRDLSRVWIVLPLLGFILRRASADSSRPSSSSWSSPSSSSGCCRAIRQAPCSATARSTPTSSGSTPSSASTSRSWCSSSIFVERCAARRSRQFDRPEAAGAGADRAAPARDADADRMAALIALAAGRAAGLRRRAQPAPGGRRHHPRRLPGRAVDAGLLSRAGAADRVRRQAALVSGRRLWRQLPRQSLPPLPAGA